MSTKRSSPYEVLIQAIDELPTLVRHTRDRRGISLRDAAEETGVSFSSLHRIELGAAPSVENLRKLLDWIMH